jgi:hypothetical protein
MYGSFVLLDNSGKLEKGERVYVGDIPGKDEGWLRDTLFENPELIPIEDIDASFGPLVPVCKELHTDAGPVDAVFINPSGRLTIAEFKLWKNPEARRQVVAQTLDYVSALTSWTYADLQREVTKAVRRPGNMLFELVRKVAGIELKEPQFLDSVSRSLKEGRFLILIAGDGIREGLQSLTELVSRGASKAFTFGLIEVALYRFGKKRFAIQPRVLARTEIVTRHMTILDVKGDLSVGLEDETESPGDSNAGTKQHLKKWWDPLLTMHFHDPEQPPPVWLATNNIVLTTPYPGIQIKAWARVDGSEMGVFLSGTPAEKFDAIEPLIKRDRRHLLDELPRGTTVDSEARYPVMLKNENPLSPDDRRAWLKSTLNLFVDVLRPRLRKWYEETRLE